MRQAIRTLYEVGVAADLFIAILASPRRMRPLSFCSSGGSTSPGRLALSLRAMSCSMRSVRAPSKPNMPLNSLAKSRKRSASASPGRPASAPHTASHAPAAASTIAAGRPRATSAAFVGPVSDPTGSAAIDAATNGATNTLTVRQSIDALPGVAQQRATFNQIIGVTVFIALVVIGLFFALLTVERTSLYGVLKALGAGMRLSPREVEVREIHARAVEVCVHGEVAACLAERGNPPLHASIADPGDGRVVATVLLAA